MGIGTGNGTTATFATTAITVNIVNIDEGTGEVTDVDTSHLGTTGSMTFIPGDLTNEGEVSLNFQIDTTEDQFPIKKVDTLTITYAQRADETLPATRVGSGYFKSVQQPTEENDTLMVGTVVFKWDGETGPTFTPAATA